MRLGRLMTAGAGSTALALAGGFLGLSPWMAGFQGSGTWSLATKTDFWSGLGLTVIGLGSLLLYRSELGQRLALAGVTSRRPQLEEDRPVLADTPNPAAVETMSDQDLLGLASQVLREVQGSESSLPAELQGGSVSEAELIRVAEALLQEIRQETPKTEPEASDRVPESRERPPQPMELMSEAELVNLASNLLEEIQRTQAEQDWVSVRKEDLGE